MKSRKNAPITEVLLHTRLETHAAPRLFGRGSLSPSQELHTVGPMGIPRIRCGLKTSKVSNKH
jgi:hypothetical protein